MKNGFTLIEALVYIAVLVLLSTALVCFLVWSITSNVKIKGQVEVTSNGERALRMIAFEIRNSQAFYSPTCVFDNDNGQLSLVFGQNLPADENITYHDIYLDNDIIYLKKESLDPLPLTNDQVRVEQLRFSIVDNDSLEINLRLKYNLDSRAQWQDLMTWQTIVSLRRAG